MNDVYTRTQSDGGSGHVLSVIIPCYNEAHVIEDTVRRLSDSLKAADVSHEFVLVNNNSTDNTEAVLQAIADSVFGVRVVNTPPLQGYGVAVRCGLENYAGDSVVIVMADGSESPEDVLALYGLIHDGFDCGFGDRFAPHSSVLGYPQLKLLLNRMGNMLIGLLMQSNYRDFTNGFKCYRRWVVDAIEPLQSNEFNLTVEMSISAMLTGARCGIVPNNWRNREVGSSKFALFRQSLLYLGTLYAVLRRRGVLRRHAARNAGYIR
jgi:dolichol-phosphate mannosyltransferase